jgi:hypothetical protein
MTRDDWIMVWIYIAGFVLFGWLFWFVGMFEAQHYG